MNPKTKKKLTVSPAPTQAQSKKNATAKENPFSWDTIVSGISKLGASIGASITHAMPKPPLSTQNPQNAQPLILTKSNFISHRPASRPFADTFKENPIEAIKTALNKPLPISKSSKFVVKDLAVGLGAIGSTVGIATYGITSAISHPDAKECKKHLTEVLKFPSELVQSWRFVGMPRATVKTLMHLFADIYIRRAEYRLPLHLSSFDEFELAALAMERKAHLWTTDPEYLPLSSKAYRPIRLASQEDANGKSFDAQTIRRWQPLTTPEIQFPLESLLNLTRPYSALKLFNADTFVEYDSEEVKELHMKEVMLDATVLSRGYQPFCDHYDALFDSKIHITIPYAVMDILMGTRAPVISELESLVIHAIRTEAGTDPMIIRNPLPPKVSSKYLRYDLVWESKASETDLQFFHALTTQAESPQHTLDRPSFSTKDQLPIGSPKFKKLHTDKGGIYQ